MVVSRRVSSSFATHILLRSALLVRSVVGGTVRLYKHHLTEEYFQVYTVFAKRLARSDTSGTASVGVSPVRG